MELQRTLPDFERIGVVPFAISYDPVSVLAKFAETHAIQYPLLSDEGSHVIRRLGLFNEQVYEHHAVYGIPKREMFWGVPYPGAFLLDGQGRVLQKRFQQSYRERETGVAILELGFGGESSLPKAEMRVQAEEVTVRATLNSDTYRWFQRLWLTVELTIAPGLHVYGEPIPSGYIPLSVEVAPIDGLEVGTPEFPVPHPYRIKGLEEEFVVYEKTVTVALPLTFTQPEAEDLTLQVTVQYQACSATDCLVPRTVQLQIPVKAADLVEWSRRK